MKGLTAGSGTYLASPRDQKRRPSHLREDRRSYVMSRQCAQEALLNASPSNSNQDPFSKEQILSIYPGQITTQLIPRSQTDIRSCHRLRRQPVIIFPSTGDRRLWLWEEGGVPSIHSPRLGP